jgi:arsenite-transporting ATPase
LALHRAARAPRDTVLLMSTDPAHSLADMLEVKLSATTTRLRTKGRVSAWQIDSTREFRKFLSANRESILSIVESGTLFTKDEIAPLLDTTLPGMAEVAALLALQELIEKDACDQIVIDTAPFGHTLRLFELPAHFRRFLDFLAVAEGRDAWLMQRFAGRTSTPGSAFIERWQEALTQVKAGLSSRNADVVLVTTPETFSLNEAARCMDALHKSVPEMKLGSIVLNRAVLDGGDCGLCRRSAQQTRKAGRWLRKQFPGASVAIGPDPGNPLLGIDQLRRFGDVVFAGARRRLAMGAPRSAVLALQTARWPMAETPLSFTVGKGGVGKTTITAALAFHARAADHQTPVMVCSTDPAPSLDDVFAKPIGDTPTPVLEDRKLTAAEFDSVAEYKRWAAGLKQRLDGGLSMESGGLHVDLTFEKQVFSALMEVVPPGVDEIFAIFRVLDLLDSGSGKLFVDMAPTGHALELLRMPERMLLWSRLLLKSLSAHRTLSFVQDVAVELASLGQRVRKLIEIMADEKRSRVWAVMLAEPVPDSQTRRLLAAVAQIGLGVDSLFVNRIIKTVSSCKRCLRRRRWQGAILQQLQRRYGGHPTYLVPEFSAEIVGRTALERFTRKLWQIQQ